MSGRAVALLITVSMAGLFTSSVQAAGPPAIGSSWSSEVSASSARLSAEVSPNGQSTFCTFEYLTEVSFEANLRAGRDGFSGAAKAPTVGREPIGSGSTPAVAKQLISGLTPQTVYVYRVVATNGAAPSGVTGPAQTVITEESEAAFALPDHRGWEMVSPADKNSGEIQSFNGNFGGDVIQASADGGEITYSSDASFGESPAGAPQASQYLSGRDVAGWATRNISMPTRSGSYGDEPNGAPYQLFSPDLSRALTLNGSDCQGPEPCPRSYALLEPPGAATVNSPATPDLRFAGASPNLRHIVFSTCMALTADAFEEPEGEGCDRADTNLYGWDGVGLTLVNDPAGETSPPPFGRLAAQAGAISEDGGRVYWSEIGTGDLWLYEAGQQARKVPSGAGATFQAASADGSFAFFTAAGNLYRYAASSDTSSLIASEVIGVLAVSPDASVAYYQTATGLFRWASGNVIEVAAGSDASQPSDFPPATGTARTSADGGVLAFLSEASLTGYENIALGSGARVSEAYLYDAAGGGELVCASCNPTRERPLGASTIPGAISNGLGEGVTKAYKPRNLSDSGRRLLFGSVDALSPRDANGVQDVYEWEAAGTGDCAAASDCVRLISSGRAEKSTTFLDASADGSDVFFLTGQSLVGTDPGSVDVYDAREFGGRPEPPAPFECEGDSCQALPSEPEDPAVGTAAAQSPGNPPLRIVSTRTKKHRHRHRNKRRHRRRDSQHGHRGRSKGVGK